MNNKCYKLIFVSNKTNNIPHVVNYYSVRLLLPSNTKMKNIFLNVECKNALRILILQYIKHGYLFLQMFA